MKDHPHDFVVTEEELDTLVLHLKEIEAAAAAELDVQNRGSENLEIAAKAADAITRTDQHGDATEPMVTPQACSIPSSVTSSVNVATPVAPVTTVAPASSIPDGYASFADGIYEMPADEMAEPVFICSPLRVDALFADQNGRGCGRLVSVRSIRGEWLEIPVSSADLQRNPANVIATLVDHGLELDSDKKSRDRLLKLLKC